MMKQTPAAAIAALGLGVVLAAAACSSGGSSSGGNRSSSTSPVTLTFWTNATPGPGLTFPERHQVLRRGPPGRDDQDAGHPERGLRRQAADRAGLELDAEHLLPAWRRQCWPWSTRTRSRRLPSPPRTRPTSARPRSQARRLTARFTPSRWTSTPWASTTARTSSSRRASPRRPPPSPSSRPMSPSCRPPASRRSRSAPRTRWPAAHWYYNFALRECSQATMNSAATSLKFTDPCWTKASDDLAGVPQDQPVPDRLPDNRRAGGRGLLGRHGGLPQGRAWSSWATGTRA